MKKVKKNLGRALPPPHLDKIQKKSNFFFVKPSLTPKSVKFVKRGWGVPPYKTNPLRSIWRLPKWCSCISSFGLWRLNLELSKESLNIQTEFCSFRTLHSFYSSWACCWCCWCQIGLKAESRARVKLPLGSLCWQLINSSRNTLNVLEKSLNNLFVLKFWDMVKDRSNIILDWPHDTSFSLDTHYDWKWLEVESQIYRVES